MKQNYIAGEWLDGSSAVGNINPSDTTDVIGYYAQGDAAQTEHAIESAYQAFPGWANSSIQQRSDMLDSISNEILARRQELGLSLIHI